MAGGLGTRMRSSRAEAPAPAARPPGRRLGDRGRPGGRRRAGSSSSPRRTRATPTRASRSPSRSEPLGTGDAVASARGALEGFDGPRARARRRHAAPHRRPPARRSSPSTSAQGAAVTILSFEPTGSCPYGRIVRGADGAVEAIVEETDATEEQRAIRELNSSIYVFEAGPLWAALEKLDAHNAQGELYLTDTIAHIVAARRARGRLGLPGPARAARDQHARRARGRRRRPARPDQRGAHARGRDDRRSGERPGSRPA